MKKIETNTKSVNKLPITTKVMKSIYDSINNVEARGRMLKDIYCGDLISFKIWLGKYIDTLDGSNQQGTPFAITISEKYFMPKNMALLIDQTGETFGVISYDIVE